MKSKHVSKVGFCLATMTLLFGSAIAIQAATSSANGVDESHKAARLLRDIKADATQVRSAAVRLDALTTRAGATWLDYDRQWNEIKPSVEDMQITLARLEAMQAAISPAERKELDQSKMLIEEIQSRTHQLRTLLDQPGVQTNNTDFKVYARSLKTEASKLDRSVAAS